MKKKLIRLRQISFRAFQSRRGRITSFSINKNYNKNKPFIKLKKNSEKAFSKGNRKVNRFVSPKYRKGFPFIVSNKFRKYRKQASIGSFIIPNYSKQINNTFKGKQIVKSPIYLFYGPRTYAKEVLREKLKSIFTKSNIIVNNQSKSP